jgi:transposase
MSKTLSATATDWREGRRLRAWELAEQGWRQCEIAAALGVTSGAVAQWMRRMREGGGVEALRKRKAPGGPCRLSEVQQAQVLEWLCQGAKRMAFAGRCGRASAWPPSSSANWGCVTIRDTKAKLLHAWGWSAQKPEQRASQHHEGAIEQWVTVRWPAIKKQGAKGGTHAAVHR